MPIRLKNDWKFALLYTLVLVGALQPQWARAGLGEPEAAVATDAEQLKASVKATSRPNYTVHEIQISSGTVLREFAVPGGAVFAVAWNGPTMPNLQQALGRYFGTFASAARSAHSGHTRLQVQQSDLVVQSSGHMRAFTGRAYLPQALPTGFSLRELQ